MTKIVVIGGGAAGMLAAYAASLSKKHVILLERNEKLGKKIYITGKGRCNVTNACDTAEFFDQIVSNSKFLYSSIYGFDATHMMQLLQQHGCPLKIERGGRVFPVSDHSSDIIATLEKILREQKVTIRKNCYVEKLLTTDLNAGETQSKKLVNGVEFTNENNRSEKIVCNAVILATGGCSYPSTGSDGNGIRLAESLGHRIVVPRPGLVPFTIQENFCRDLQGLALKNVQLALKRGKKTVYEGFGEMLFTHFGISGPLVLSAASYYGRERKEGDYTIHIDLKPALDREKLDKRILREFEENRNKQLKNVIINMLPGKLASVFPARIGLSGERSINSITKEERMRILELFKDFEMHVEGTRGFEEAIITMGGVSVKDINPSTMQSKQIPNLYFAGEIMDVDALTGGFNLQIAWSTGYLAGCEAGGLQR